MDLREFDFNAQNIKEDDLTAKLRRTTTLQPIISDDDYLLRAIASNDISAVKSAIIGTSGNLSSSPGRRSSSPLWTAIHQSSAAIVELLINHGANIHERQIPKDLHPNFSLYDYSSRISLLHWATLKRSTEKMRVLLRRGADANACDSRGKSVLQYAIESPNVIVEEILLREGAAVMLSPDVQRKTVPWYRSRPPGLEDQSNMGVKATNLEMVKLLLEHGADPARKNQQGLTALHVLAAARVQDVDVAEILLKTGVPVDGATRLCHYTPLHFAVQSGKIQVAKLLLDNGADPNETTRRGEFPLLLAIEQDSSEFVRLLLSRRADIRRRTEKGQTLLQRACHLGLRSIARILLAHGADCDVHDREGNHVLHCAVTSNESGVIRLLLNVGVDVDARDAKGCTALHLAAHAANARITVMLLMHGADARTTNCHGQNGLHFAARSQLQSLLVAEEFLARGVGTHVADDWGFTALHFACMNGKEALVRLLVKHGADVNAPTNMNEFPLSLCVRRGSPQLVEFLLLKGAKVNQRTMYGETAIYTACRYESEEKIRVLLEYGADVNLTDKMNLTPFHWMTYKHRNAGKAIIKHMAKLASFNLTAHEKDLCIINENPELRMFYTKCVEELKLMRAEKFYNNISFHAVLCKKHSELVSLTRNEEFVESFETELNRVSFPLYASDLRSKFMKAEKRRDELTAAEAHVHSAFSRHLPTAVIQEIAQYLTIEDIRNDVQDVYSCRSIPDDSSCTMNDRIHLNSDPSS